MKYLISLICLLNIHSLFAQTYDYSKLWKNVSLEELRMREYAQDPEAQALVLYDRGVSSFMQAPGGFEIWYTRTKRIKLFNKNADEHATVEIPAYVDGLGRFEEVVRLEAFTYNLQGDHIEKVALDPADIYVEKVGNHWIKTKFTFPALQEGSVLEYKYVFRTPFLFKLPDWTFQAKIPTLHSECIVKMIPFFEYLMRKKGFAEFDSTSVYASRENRFLTVFPPRNFQEHVHTFIMYDVPAFKDEAFITSVNDYLMKLGFQLTTVIPLSGKEETLVENWAALSDGLLEEEAFGGFLDDCKPYAKKIVKRQDLSGMSEAQKSKHLIEYVKQHYSWEGTSAIYAQKSAKEFFTQKTGTAAEINLFLAAVLQYAGLDVHPVLVSTRDNGKVNNNYPFVHLFNYLVVIQFGERPFVADATERLLAFNRVPPRCFNDQGLVIKGEGQASWVQINQNLLSHDRKQLIINIDPDELVATCNISIQSTEYDAYRYKTQFKRDTSELIEYLEMEGFSEIEDIAFTNFEKTSTPYIMHFNAQKEIEPLQENLMVAPFLGFIDEENPFTQAERQYDIDFTYAHTEQYSIYLGIPEGYSLPQLPENVFISDPLFDMGISYKLEGRLLEINARYSFKRSVYQAEDYHKIKDFMEKLSQHFNTRLLLQKT